MQQLNKNKIQMNPKDANILISRTINKLLGKKVEDHGEWLWYKDRYYLKSSEEDMKALDDRLKGDS